MNLSALKSLGNGGVKKAAFRTMFALRKYSPEILTTTGVIGTVTAAVLASKATLNLEPIIDNTKYKIEGAEQKTHSMTADEYSSTDHKKAMLGIYVEAAGDIAKLYGPSVILGAVSIGCIIGGHGVLHKRNVAAIAAYKGLEETFNKYRARVLDEFGPEKDRDFRYGIRDEVVQDEKGKDQTIKVIDPELVPTEVKFFDETNRNWAQSPDYNLNFLRAQETQADQRLRAEGFLFLNDVLESLGFERTRAGAVTGWVHGEGGDDFVDFGIIDCQSMGARVFGTEDTDAILLNFNIDGVIIDSPLIPQK